MNIDELKRTYPEYKVYAEDWQQFKAAFGGTKPLIQWGALKQNERESKQNYERRISNAFGFNYSKGIVDILNFYLFQKPANSDYGALENDPLFQMFLADADLIGTRFNKWIIRQSRWSSVYGTQGILVDKPPVTGIRTVNSDVQDKLYPFVTAYSPLNILDFKYERINGRPTLIYLKLLDDNGCYRIWTREEWQLWEIVDGKPEQVEAGINPLGEIPFFWLDNGDTSKPYLGQSDIDEVSAIDISIMRNLSQGEEIIDYAAFPMILKPARMPGEEPDDSVGVTAVLEFDPREPNSKPAWLEAAVGEPIDAILRWMSTKVTEIYRSQNTTGIVTSSDAKSGEALKREFQMLNSRLSAKADAIEKAEYKVIEYWCKWQNKLEVMAGVSISRPRDFDVSDLAQDLDNLLVSKGLVASETFSKAVQRIVARRALPGLSITEVKAIDEEVEAGMIQPDVMQDVTNT